MVLDWEPSSVLCPWMLDDQSRKAVPSCIVRAVQLTVYPGHEVRESWLRSHIWSGELTKARCRVSALRLSSPGICMRAGGPDFGRSVNLSSCLTYFGQRWTRQTRQLHNMFRRPNEKVGAAREPGTTTASAMTDSFVSDTSAVAPQLRSCTVCRQRKVKCDRKQPCSNCTRSGCDCVYPSGRGRAPKRPRHALDAQLADKLGRLETIIKHLASENASQAAALPAHHNDTARTEPSSSVPGVDDTSDQASLQDDSARASSASSRPSPSAPPGPSIEGEFSRLMIKGKTSYYLSNPLWASLANEIDEMREIIVKPEDEDEEERAPTWPEMPSNNNCGLNAALFGYRAIAHSLQPYHPMPHQALDIFSAFTENVSPLLRLFHVPSLSVWHGDAINSTAPLDKNAEALIFAIYYSAVLSMSPDQCIAVLGFPRDAAVQRYRFAAEQAIARADLLSTQSVVLLQAVVLLISALRCHDDSRASWSLATMVFHLAQAMGLHRDGTVFGLRPFDTEIRRRLWWHICILDSRSWDYYGFGPVMYQSTFDTRMPLNINDADLSPEMTEPPVEREGGTDMTFCLVRCETIRAALRGKLLSPDAPKAPAQTGGVPEVSPSTRLAVLHELEERFAQRYDPHCNSSSSPILVLTSLMTRLTTKHFVVIVHYPKMWADGGNGGGAVKTGSASTASSSSTPKSKSASPPKSGPDAEPPRPGADGRDNVTRDQVFHCLIEILELSGQILSHPATIRFAWYSRSHVQWHVVAFVLAEICRRPPSPDCDRAWAAVTTMYEAWDMQASAMQGIMWKSVQRLMAKARYVREMQALGRVFGRSAAPAAAAAAAARDAPALSGWPTDYATSTNTPAAAWSTPGPAGFGAGADLTSDLGFQQGFLGMGSNDPFMDMLNMSVDMPMDDVFGDLGVGQSSLSADIAPVERGPQGTGWTSWG